MTGWLSLRPESARLVRRQKGFTLAELAVAFVIIGLLLAGALMPISAQMEVRSVADTRRTMDSIRDAVIGFAQSNGRLPCPANGALAMGAAGAGTEQWDSTNNRCTTALGVVPWSSLGVAEVDAWGRRFTYRVTSAFADAISNTTYAATTTLTPVNAALASPANQSPACSAPVPTPALSTFALCSLGDIAVFTRSDSSHNTSAIAAGIPAIIISHGKNGYGAFQPSGTRVIGSGDGNSDGVPDQNVDEAANINGTTQLTAVAVTGSSYLHNAYISRNASTATSSCSDSTAGSPFCEFDDIVLAISPSTLITRMISASRLP